MSLSDAKEDKYEQLLAKYDWHSPYPPKTYQYGVGRGAKAFVTTAELTTAGATGTRNTREENDFFSAMERLEESKKAHKKRREESADEADTTGRRLTSPLNSAAAAGGPVKLTLDDLATLDLPTARVPLRGTASAAATASQDSHATATAGGTAAAGAATAPPPVSAASLVVRSARTEEGDAAEEHVFADERGLTASDVLRGKASAVQVGLHNVLAMGSTEDQTTWITHARAYREMGMTKRAWQTLVEGCAVTGKKGKRIWEERLRYIARDNLAGRRRLLEEATTACPTEEALWTQLLDVVPPLERVPCLQRAVLACPSSEHLWLRLVQFVPSPQDQRVLLQRALQHTPHLPLLWARLARLESYKTGREMFQAAAARFPSLALIIEAAKYVEWYALSHWIAEETIRERGKLPEESTSRAEVSVVGGDGGAAAAHIPSRAMQGRAVRLYDAVCTADREVGDLVRTAQLNYLNMGEAGSRLAWLSLALSLLRTEYAESPLAESVEEGGGATAAPGLSHPAASKSSAYVCTAAHMFLCVVDPSHKGLSGNAVPATWLQDLVALFPAEATLRYEVQCALWHTWILLQRRHVKEAVPQGNTVKASSSSSSSSSSSCVAHSKETLAVLEAVLLSAPSAAVHSEVPWLLHGGDATDAAANEEEAESCLTKEASVNTAATTATAAVGGTAPEAEEEEEEELGQPAVAVTAAKITARSSTSAAAVAAAATKAGHFPSPLMITVAATLGLTVHVAALPITASHPPSLTAVLRVLIFEVPLALSEALYRRGCHAAALAVVDVVLPSSSLARPSRGVLSEDPEEAKGGDTLPSAAPAPLPRAGLDGRRSTAYQSLHIARAKYLAALGDDAAADQCLLEAINAAASEHNSSSAVSHEESWVKLAVLRRSLGQPIDSILRDAVQQCPRSWRLWLMLLEERRRAIDSRLQLYKATAGPRATTAEALRTDDALAAEVREVRMLCKKAVTADYCRTVPMVWIFAAQRIEADLLLNVPAATALLTDATAACAAALHSSRAQLLTRTLSPQEVEKQAAALAQIGVARARLEAQYGTPGQALETVQEALQRLPKTRDGAFAVAQDDAVGELLSLFITLEPPASRGRAAAQVVRQWKSREPLALCAVAQLYYTAGQYARALDQAVKAVEASKGRCGDAVGLLWRIADQTVVQPFVRRQLEGNKEEGEEGVGTAAAAGDEGSKSDLAPQAVQQWVLSVVAAAAAGMAHGERLLAPSTVPSSSLSAELVVPHSGPLWIAVAKAEDPTNVTIRGYRRPVLQMLREVADRTELKGPGSSTAPALRL